MSLESDREDANTIVQQVVRNAFNFNKFHLDKFYNGCHKTVTIKARVELPR